MKDMELVQAYHRQGSDAAFAELVRRHINLVYSGALRQVGMAAHAEEITQAVFIILARKAGGLRADTILEGWLHVTTRLTALRFQRGERRRQIREQEAYMQSTLNQPETETWEQIQPLLDEALSRMGQKDRDAVILRYFGEKSLSEVATAMNVTEAAAQSRVQRALEKLRKIFAKRGVTLTATVIAGAVAANSVQAAPVGLAVTISAVAVAKGAVAGTSTLTLVKGTLKFMAWAKYKTFISVGVISAITGGALVTAVLHEQPHELSVTKTSVSPPVVVLREPVADSAFLWLETPPGAVVVRPDGKIIIGTSLFGTFIDPQSGRVGKLDRLAVQLNADGSLDRSFYCDAELKASDAGQAHLALLPDGKFLATGMFNSAQNQPRPGYARFLSDGSLDEAFVPWFTNALWMPTEKVVYNYLDGTFGGIRRAAIMGDGSLAVVSPLGVCQLDSTGRLISPYTNNLPSEYSNPIQNDGFWLEQQGKPAKDFFSTLFAKFPIELFRIALRLPDGGAIVGIRDRFVNGILTAPGRFMRFDKDWQTDFSFTNFYEADRRCSMTIKRLRDGKFLVAGGFTKMNGEDFPGIVRLNEDGQIDHSFHCQIETSVPSRPVTDFAIQEDGRIVICGTFTAVNGVKRRYIARLNEDGSLDEEFNNPFIGLDEFQALRFPVYHLAAKTPPPANNTNAPGAIAMTIPPETILITSMNYQGGVAVIQFTGSPNQTYILQSKDSLDAADWSNISTNQAGANGNGNFRDTDAQNHPMRFYRIATP